MACRLPHFNPVKHGYASAPVLVRFDVVGFRTSTQPTHCNKYPVPRSIHRYLREGIIQSDWAVGDEFNGCFGEV